MKKTLPAMLAGILLSLVLNAQEPKHPVGRKINFFIISKPRKHKLDLASRFNILRTGIRSVFRKNFVSLVAADANDMTVRVTRVLKKRNATIGTLWFDSHGLYKTGHSLFFIGKNELNYLNIRDSQQSCFFQPLAPFCTSQTNVVIGSCYGGATFHRIVYHSDDSVRMNGDSLMMGLSKILGGSKVYGSESWVMTKPGLFKKHNAVAGYPARKLFRDVVYRPAWQHVGVWNVYADNQMRQIPPVTMDRHGNVLIRPFPFMSKDRVRKKVARKMERLEPGLLKT